MTLRQQMRTLTEAASSDSPAAAGTTEWPARPRCTCNCGCRQKPGRRIICPGCYRYIGPGCCWDFAHHMCHVCFQWGFPEPEPETQSLFSEHQHETENRYVGQITKPQNTYVCTPPTAHLTDVTLQISYRMGEETSARYSPAARKAEVRGPLAKAKEDKTGMRKNFSLSARHMQAYLPVFPPWFPVQALPVLVFPGACPVALLRWYTNDNGEYIV